MAADVGSGAAAADDDGDKYASRAADGDGNGGNAGWVLMLEEFMQPRTETATCNERRKRATKG